MTDSELRKRFNFGAPASWSSNGSDSVHGVPATPSLPGAYIPDDPVDDIPNSPGNVPPPANATPENPDKTCRICLSGAEDGSIMSR